MKRKEYIGIMIVLVLITMGCKKNNSTALPENIDISVSLEHEQIMKDSSNLVKVDFINKSNDEIKIIDGYIQLQLTSALTGINKSIYINLAGEECRPEKKYPVVIEINGNQVLSKQFDLTKILLDNMMTGNFYLSLVLEVDKKNNQNQKYEGIRSNAVEVTVI